MGYERNLERIDPNYDETLLTEFFYHSRLHLLPGNLQYVGNLHTKYQYIMGIFLEGPWQKNILEATIYKYVRIEVFHFIVSKHKQ